MPSGAGEGASRMSSRSSGLVLAVATFKAGADGIGSSVVVTGAGLPESRGATLLPQKAAPNRIKTTPATPHIGISDREELG